MYPLELKLRDIRNAWHEMREHRHPSVEPAILQTECVSYPVNIPFGPEASSGRPMCSDRKMRYHELTAHRIGPDRYQILETQATGGLFAAPVDTRREVLNYDDAAKKLEDWSKEQHKHPMWKQQDARPEATTPMHFSRRRRPAATSAPQATAG